MRKIVYSNITKFIAVLLFIASIVSGVLIASDGVLEYFNQDEEIYNFEGDFSESWYITSLLSEPENIMYMAYHSTFYEEKYGEWFVKEDMDSEEIREELTNQLNESFGNHSNFDKLNYYVQWNDLVLTNCGAERAEDLMKDAYYSYLRRDAGGYVEREISGDRDMSRVYLLEEIDRFDSSSTIVICCSVKEDTVADFKATWELQEAIVLRTLSYTAVFALVALLMLIYLVCVCGKNSDGEYKNMWLDNVWLEGHLASIAAFGLGGIALCLFVLEEYAHGNFSRNLVYPVLGAVAGIVSIIFVTSLLSIIRNLKTRRLVSTSIILRVLKWCIRLVKKTVKWMWRITKAFWRTIFGVLSKKTGFILITLLFVYTAIIGLFGVLTIVSPIWLVLGVLLFGVACFLVSCRARDLDEIKKGVSEVRNGNVGYKIPELKCEDMKALATNINDIAIGLDESVSAKVKAERMKTELITNVSHDLKTPITSIISYTELLTKIEDLPEEARDYVAVIAKKSDRLNRLTQDLFDISKVQSGNEDVVLEKLDASLLISQALAEHDNEIQASGLPFCVNAPKGLHFAADGRKMSRVYSNLISNILKYAMKNTRVFITASEKDGMIEVEFKNISAYPLNFNVEEITQRFVRGDESRSADGNGLGLAIAKSYTEICNGVFEIVVDGDMFKAIMKFKKYS